MNILYESRRLHCEDQHYSANEQSKWSTQYLAQLVAPFEDLLARTKSRIRTFPSRQRTLP